MKKITAIVFALLVCMQVAFATERIGSRITTYDKGDRYGEAVLKGYTVLDADSSNDDESVLCAEPDGSSPQILVNAKSKESWQQGVTKALEMLKNWAKYPQLSRHYYCVREKY